MQRQDNSSAPNATQPAMFRVTFATLLSLTLSSGVYSAWLANQPKLAPYQIQVLTTSTQVCYGGSTALFAMLSTKKLPRKHKQDSENKTEE